MPFIVPPGGLAGFSQMTPASKASLFPRGSRSNGKRRKTARRKTVKARKTARRRAKKGPKFGSPAFQKLHKVGKYRRK